MGKPVDLEAWAKFFRQSEDYGVAQDESAARTIIAALEKFTPELDEIEQAAQRPYAQFPVHYEEAPYAALPHLSVLSNLNRILSLRASARLAAGQTEAAATDILLSLRILWLLRDELTLINHLVVSTSLLVTLQPVREGLSTHQWNGRQLDAMQEALTKIDLLLQYRRALRGEAAFVATTYRLIRNRPDDIANMYGMGADSADKQPLFRIIPAGFFYLNENLQTRIFFDTLLPAIDAETHVVDTQKIDAFETRLSDLRENRFRLDRSFALLSLPVYVNVTQRVAEICAFRDLAITALGLERFRLEKRDYPAALNELAPGPPVDVTTGAPLQYRRDGNTFVLYSVGWNRTDEDGKIVLKKNGRSLERTKGDWVWPHRQLSPTDDLQRN